MQLTEKERERFKKYFLNVKYYEGDSFRQDFFLKLNEEWEYKWYLGAYFHSQNKRNIIIRNKIVLQFLLPYCLDKDKKFLQSLEEILSFENISLSISFWWFWDYYRLYFFFSRKIKDLLIQYIGISKDYFFWDKDKIEIGLDLVDGKFINCKIYTHLDEFWDDILKKDFNGFIKKIGRGGIDWIIKMVDYNKNNIREKYYFWFQEWKTLMSYDFSLLFWKVSDWWDSFVHYYTYDLFKNKSSLYISENNKKLFLPND